MLKWLYVNRNICSLWVLTRRSVTRMVISQPILQVIIRIVVFTRCYQKCRLSRVVIGNNGIMATYQKYLYHGYLSAIPVLWVVLNNVIIK